MKLYQKLLSGVATTLFVAATWVAATWAMSPSSPEPVSSGPQANEAVAHGNLSDPVTENFVDNVGSSGIWSRDKAICSGMRVMIVDPDKVSFIEKAPQCRPFIGRVAVVYEVTTENSENHLTILDEFGLGKVLERDVITLRRRNAAQQIESRIPKDHRGIAKAEFASLYDLNAAKAAFKEELKRFPENEEFKTRYALLLSQIIDLEGLAELELNEHDQSDSVRQVITAALLPHDQHIERLATIADSEPKNIFARTELVKLAGMLVLSENEENDSLYWKQHLATDQVVELIPDHPVVHRNVFITAIRSYGGKTVDVASFPTLMANTKKSAQRFRFTSDLTRSLAIGHFAAEEYESAQRYTLEAIQKFPADERTIATITMFVDSGEISGKLKQFTKQYAVETLASIFTDAQQADFDTGGLPSVRCIDGDPLKSTEANEEEDAFQGWEKLCILDDVIAFRYLQANGYDLASMPIDELKELVELSIKVKSYHSLDFLLGQVNEKLAPSKADLFEFAVAEESVVMLPVLCKYFGEIPVAVRESYAVKSNIESSETADHIQKETLEILVLKIPLQFMSSKMKCLSLQAMEREKEEIRTRLILNAQRQEVHGDFDGYQQSQNYIAQADQILSEIRNQIAECSRVAQSELENEFELVKTLLDEQGVDEWAQSVSEHVDEAMPWFKSDFDEWNSNRKRS